MITREFIENQRVLFDPYTVTSRCNEKELKVKPATKLYILSIFINKKNETKFKTEKNNII